MTENTIIRTSLRTINEALNWDYGYNSERFAYYVEGVINVTNSLLEQAKKEKEKNAQKSEPKPKKKFFI